MIRRYVVDNKTRKAQSGFALIMVAFILGLVAAAIILNTFSPAAMRNAREQKTAESLMLAKSALIAYATTANLTSLCTTSCNRPGELPCPDTNNDGIAEVSCALPAQHLGRLPYKTLGLDDIRDGYGERLWYAVSNSFINSPRIFPLNSDTIGTITIRDSQGTVINNGTDMSGAIAVIFAPGAALTRTDGVTQVRDLANENNPINYLDNSLSEDNATFIDGSATDGFIMGDIKSNTGTLLLNDRLAVITHDDLFPLVEARVVAEVSTALQTYFTITTNPNSFFPNAASFNDVSCLGVGNIAGCASIPGSMRGRIPANPTTGWDASSILSGDATNSWFQQNAWREVVYYGVSSACAEGTANCVEGNLTLVNALTSPTYNKKVIIIATGKAIGTQSRAIKTAESDYLEGENLSPLDNVYIRTVPGNTINDLAISIP